MTREEAIAKLEEVVSWDTETAHVAADGVLCALLESLGYKDVVAAWYLVPKWYA